MDEKKGILFDAQALLKEEGIEGAEELSEESEKLLEEYETTKRKFPEKSFWDIFITVATVLCGLYHIYSLAVKATSPIIFRDIHLVFGLILIFLIYPTKRKFRKVNAWDILLSLAAIAVCVYVAMQDQQDFAIRSGSRWTKLDIVFGLISIFTIMVSTKRVIGWPLIIVSIVFTLYALFGEYMPGMFINRSYKWQRIVSYVFSMDGIFGTPIGTSSTYVILFIIFGSFLKNSGAGDFYTNFSYAIAGRTRGGPAKVAVISSALFGTISGSGIANVVTTGSITIPLQKKAGFSGTYAGAVEAVSSSGGQIMPPVMGAAAFLLAEMIGINYSDVVISAILPALLYFLAVFFVVDLQAGKRGLRGLSKDELPSLKRVMKEEGHLIIPLVVLLVTLFSNYTVIKAAFLSTISCIIVSWFRKDTRMGWQKIILSLKEGVLGCLEVIAACAAAGIIMALVNLTGVGTKLSYLVQMAAQGHLLFALLLTALVVIILSMGLPTTACYLVSATIMSRPLVELGISPIQAHMFIFYFACMSGITPPVALVAYPAAAIAKADPVKTSFLAFRIGIVGFLIPFMFVYSPSLLLIGSAGEIALTTVTAIIGVYFLSVGFEKFFLRYELPTWAGVLTVLAGISMMVPGWLTDVIGVGVAVIVLGISVQLAKRNKRIAGTPSVEAAPAVKTAPAFEAAPIEEAPAAEEAPAEEPAPVEEEK